MSVPGSRPATLAVVVSPEGRTSVTSSRPRKVCAAVTATPSPQIVPLTPVCPPSTMATTLLPARSTASARLFEKSINVLLKETSCHLLGRVSFGRNPVAHITRVARWRLSEWRVALYFLGQNRTFAAPENSATPTVRRSSITLTVIDSSSTMFLL